MTKQKDFEFELVYPLWMTAALNDLQYTDVKATEPTEQPHGICNTKIEIKSDDLIGIQTVVYNRIDLGELFPDDIVLKFSNRNITKVQVLDQLYDVYGIRFTPEEVSVRLNPNPKLIYVIASPTSQKYVGELEIPFTNR